MNFIDKLIYSRLIALDFTNPLTYLDLFLALFLIVGTVVYLRRFPSFRVILGVLLLFLLTALFFLLGFIFTAVVLGFASFWIIFALPLIFSSEIRHYLGKLGRFSYLRRPIAFRPQTTFFIRNIVDAVYELAERKIGATLVLIRKTGLEQTTDTGILIDARFSSKLLTSIFSKGNPLHDGAVIIKNDRIYAAGCLLPVRGDIRLEGFGTRHKAGLSISLDTDAVVIIVSEQTGAVSLAENGKLESNLDRMNLTEKLNKLL